MEGQPLNGVAARAENDGQILQTMAERFQKGTCYSGQGRAKPASFMSVAPTVISQKLYHIHVQGFHAGLCLNS